MYERIANLVDNGAIQLCLSTSDNEVYLFIERLGQVTHHPWEPVKDRFHRHHPQLEHNILQVAAHTRHVLNRLRQFGALHFTRKLLKSNTIDKQLAE
ncbi:hypothetical protein D3C85_1668540 [compost metagenome]